MALARESPFSVVAVLTIPLGTSATDRASSSSSVYTYAKGIFALIARMAFQMAGTRLSVSYPEPCPAILLAAQRFHWIDFGCTPGRQIASQEGQEDRSRSEIGSRKVKVKKPPSGENRKS